MMNARYEKFAVHDLSARAHLAREMVWRDQLCLCGSAVEDLRPLRGLLRLQSLDLQNTCVTRVSPLSHMTDLITLNLPDLGQLEDLCEIKTLHDAGVKIRPRVLVYF